jgi:hypothetical protein
MAYNVIKSDSTPKDNTIPNHAITINNQTLYLSTEAALFYMLFYGLEYLITLFYNELFVIVHFIKNCST